MVAKSILEIDVNDDKFTSFMEKFREYQAALDELPEAWRGAAQGIGDSAKETAKAKVEGAALAKAFSDGADAILSINSGLDRLSTSIEEANKKQKDFNKNARSSGGFLKTAAKDAKSIAGHIKNATTSLLSWGSIVGVFTGVLGAGGLFGINRLAATTGAQRFTSLGLGTTIGGMDAAAINYQKALGNPTATLGAIRDAKMDLSKRWTFSAMGINNPDQDPAKLLPQMIRNARDIFVKSGSTAQGANAYGLTNFFSLDDLNRFKNMTDEEIDAMQKRAEKDSQLLQITDQQARQWQDFNVQLDYSSQSIRNAFVRGLGPLTPALTKLSEALTSAIDTVLISPELGKWIDGLANGIQRFGNYLASPEFTTDVNDFMSGIKKMALAVMDAIKLFTGQMSVSEYANKHSTMLSNETVKDPQTGKEYIPGTDGDPRVSPLLKRARSFLGPAPTQYDQYFEEAAKANNVDARWLKAIAGAESSWDPNAKSSAGAQGLMQVMPFNFQPGEKPFDPRDNIMAGARVLAWAMQQSGGDFDEALRYYNGGSRRGSAENIAYPGRVKEQFDAMYGGRESTIPGNTPDNVELSKSAQKTNQLLQQLVDRGVGGNGGGVAIYNNTGGNAIISSAQMGVPG
ncbi:lytic transglycosylase domain-containing protein [Pectobacterium odoriferum]|uniref:lytic transglycosylase domain-containing protein n=1 Tax=Pectobacterium odoriferum TaxID=78398 RepID=UPI001373FB33|nr:lytic transglycosylase domain-containing protein [Pectobacterium odoriferum]QHP80644.1 lytic transglycosylase domain-containing protein [Pectobacterium odoriferum]